MDVARVGALAAALRERNAIDARIASLIGRPALPGHLGEWIAAQVFDIELAASAVQKGIDGWFRAAPRPRATVNIKLYGTRGGFLDLVEDHAADYYLALTGPISQPVSSRGTHRPVCIHGVYLFETSKLLADLRGRGLKIGVASSVRKALWEEAEVFPRPVNEELPLSHAQVVALEQFASI